MRYLRFALLPFALIYGGLVAIRNFLYRIGWFRSTKFSVPTINVGNLSMGGTGKTPHVEYLIRLLSEKLSVVTLSRGFGRKTTGFILAGENDNAETIGDEPYQYYHKFKDEIGVAVEAKRVLGVVDIMRELPNTEVILLDDAYQHRALESGFNILLTTFSSPYSSDFILPIGNLREFRKGSARADLIIVTKSPKSDYNKETWRRQLGVGDRPLFFSSIIYGGIQPVFGNTAPTFNSVIVVTGIADSSDLLNHLEGIYEVVHHFKFKDHHRFKSSDIQSIHNLFDKFANDKNLGILTTEKDAMRLSLLKNEIEGYPWFFQEISVEIHEKEKFDAIINQYVQKAY